MEILGEIRYRRGDQIGAGEGMNSTVFLATDPQLQGALAVKEIPKAKLGNDLDSYFEEARIMFASAHPNVVRIQYACQTSDQVCLAMPYYPAGSLAHKIISAPLPLNEIVRVGDSVLSGLSQVHRKRFLHLDVKPTNVLFDGARPMLADFGQSREARSNGVVQVPEMYMHAWPPEVVTLGTATVESDIFQVGLLLYRAANGEPWYQTQIPSPQALEFKIVNGKFPDRSSFMPHVPRRLRRVIRKALRVDATDRYHSAIEMARDLGRLEVTLDWVVSETSAGGTRWSAERVGQPELVVELTRLSAASLRVEAYTTREEQRRAKRPLEFSRTFGTSKDAMDHLNWVFSELA